jgi:hypothetical protein
MIDMGRTELQLQIDDLDRYRRRSNRRQRERNAVNGKEELTLPPYLRRP